MVDSYVITSENGNRFLIVNPVKYDGSTYYQATRLDNSGKLTSEYCVLKQIVKNGKEYYEVVKDKKIGKELMVLFTLMLMQDVALELPKEGSLLEINGRRYALLAYIAYKEKPYMYLTTLEEPLDIVIGKLVPGEKDEDLEIEDVTGTEEGIQVMKIHAELYGN